jgi:hypothetical protein
MGLILTATAGLAVWIVLWALNVKGFVGFLIPVLMLIIAICVRNVIPYLPGRREE